MSNSLRPHRLQHARPPCPSPTPRVYSNSCPLSWWCHPTISSSVVPFSSRLQSFPTSGSEFSNESVLHIRWPEDWSFSISVSPSNEYSGLISSRMDWRSRTAVWTNSLLEIKPRLDFWVTWPLAHFFTSVCLGRPIFKAWIRVSTFHLESCAVCLATQSCPTLVTPEIVARQAPLSMGFSRQEHWSGLPFPPPWDLADPGSNPHLLHCRWVLHCWATREAHDSALAPSNSCSLTWIKSRTSKFHGHVQVILHQGQHCWPYHMAQG